MNLENEKPLDTNQPSSSSIERKSTQSINVVDEHFPLKVKEAFYETRTPIILKGLDIGPCRTKWSPEYLLRSCDPEKRVKVHKSKEKTLDFLKKNFVYESNSFRDLVYLCAGLKSDEIEKEKYEYYWYLRSLGEDPRGRDVSDLSVHFPKLSEDLIIPDLFPKESFFSSVFRITSPELQLWTHYDTCDNILIQVRGRKRVVFFPPTEALNLYLDGDKSEIVDIDDPDLKQFPKFKDIQSYEAILEEGDVIFIPALWFHNITALDFSVSVNVFWKNLNAELYDKKDPYGNKDLIPAQLGYRTLEKVITQLKVLPDEYQDFYIRRMITRLDKRLSELKVTHEKEVKPEPS